MTYKYIKALSLLFFIFGLLGSISGIIILLSFKTSMFSGSWVETYIVENEVKEFRSILNLVFYFPMLIASFGLYLKKIWARNIGIVWSALNLPLFPYGTIIGLFALWVLMKKKVKVLFGVKESSLI